MMSYDKYSEYPPMVTCPDKSDPCSQPEIHKRNTVLMSALINFFETAFDWDNMVYELQPYFWSRKCKWEELYSLDDNDTLFKKFLQAGAAKVVVPVRKGNEANVLYYKKTGIVSGIPGVINDTISVSVMSEINRPPLPTIVNSWISKLPTNLVAMQCNSSCIDDEGGGLPCNDLEELENEPPAQ